MCVELTCIPALPTYFADEQFVKHHAPVTPARRTFSTFNAGKIVVQPFATLDRLLVETVAWQLSHANATMKLLLHLCGSLSIGFTNGARPP